MVAAVDVRAAAAVVAAVVVGLALVVAGGAKLAAGPSWPVQARELGAPPVVVPVLPWIELAVGAVLVTQFARRPAAVVALLLLGSFTALIARRLAEGKHPPCACFGAWSARPLGAGHLLRNAVLLVLSGVALL